MARLCSSLRPSAAACLLSQGPQHREASCTRYSFGAVAAGQALSHPGTRGRDHHGRPWRFASIVGAAVGILVMPQPVTAMQSSPDIRASAHETELRKFKEVGQYMEQDLRELIDLLETQAAAQFALTKTDSTESSGNTTWPSRTPPAPGAPAAAPAAMSQFASNHSYLGLNYSGARPLGADSLAEAALQRRFQLGAKLQQFDDARRLEAIPRLGGGLKLDKEVIKGVQFRTTNSSGSSDDDPAVLTFGGAVDMLLGIFIWILIICCCCVGCGRMFRRAQREAMAQQEEELDEKDMPEVWVKMASSDKASSSVLTSSAAN